MSLFVFNKVCGPAPGELDVSMGELLNENDGDATLDHPKAVPSPAVPVPAAECMGV